MENEIEERPRKKKYLERNSDKGKNKGGKAQREGKVGLRGEGGPGT